MRPESCARLGGHCGHWGLSAAEHALVHMLVRRLDEVFEQDMAAGHAIGGGSASSLSEDGPRLLQLLEEEGFTVVRR